MSQKRQILVQNALALLCEAQRQATNLKEDTQEELKDMMNKVSALTKESMVQLLQTWHDNKEHLPEKLVGEMDRLLDKIGLVRKSKTSTKTPSKNKAKPISVRVTTPAKKQKATGNKKKATPANPSVNL